MTQTRNSVGFLRLAGSAFTRSRCHRPAPRRNGPCASRRPIAVAAMLAVHAGLAAAVPVSWVDPNSNFWDVNSAWSSGAQPLAADDVTLGLAGTRTITFRSGNSTINSLAISGGNTLAITGGTLSTGTLNSSSAISQSSGTFSVGAGDLGTYNLSAGTLALSGIVTTSGNLRLQGGTVSGGTLQQTASSGLVPTSGAATLSGVTVHGALNIGDPSNLGGRLRISNGLMVRDLAGVAPGVVNVGVVAGANAAILGFTGTQTFDNGTINLGNSTQSAGISLDGNGTFTLGSNGRIQGSGGNFTVQFVGGTGNIVNNGTISANFNGRTLTLNNSGTLNNNGLLEARNGGILTLSAAGGANAGMIRVVDSASTVNLAGAMSTSSLGSFDNVAGGQLNLSGTLANTGNTLNFSAATGSMRLVNGTVAGGTVQLADGQGLIFTSSNGTLSNVTWRGLMNVGDATNSSGRVRISGGLAVQDAAGATPGVVNVGTVTGATNAVLGFTGTQTFDNATINLGSASQNGAISLDGNGTFTLGSNGRIQGSGGNFTVQFVGGTGNIINNGTFSANLSGRTLNVNNSGTLTNNGLLEARNGGILTLSPAGGANAGTIRVVDAASTVNLAGAMSTSSLGTFDNAAGGNLNLTGSIDNTGNTLSFSAATGSMRLLNGTVTGGTLQMVDGQGLILTSSNGTLSNVTWRGVMNVGDATNTGARVRISGSLVVQDAAGAVPGVVNVGTIAGASSAILGFTGTQTFDNATINLGSATQNGAISLDGNGTFTLGSNGRIQGSGGNFTVQFVGGTGNIVNNGTFSANLPGRTLNVDNSGTLTNNGLLEARNGGILTLSPAGGANAGTIRVVDSASTVNLAGVMSTSSLGTFDNAAGGNLNLSGSIDNTGNTLSFSAATGSMRLVAGSVSGGTVQVSPSQGLVLTNNNGTLSNVTWRGVMNVGDATNTSGRVRISGGLAVQDAAGATPGVVNVGTIAGATNAILGFTGTQTFDNATINLGSATQNGTISLDGNGTFTLGSNGRIQGSGGNFGVQFVGGTGNIVNNGTFSANLPGRPLTLNNSGTLANNGLLEARNGGILTLSAAGGANAGTIRVVDSASTVNLAGAISTSSLGTFDNAAAGQLNLSGTLTNTANTLSFSAATGSMRLLNGTVTGGTVQTADGQALIFTGSNGTLNNVTWRGVMNVGDATNASARVRISGGLAVLDAAGTAPGVVNVGTANGATSTILGFNNTQTFDNATINLGSATQNGTISLDGGGTFTLGSNGRIQGSGGSFAVQFVGGTNNLLNNGVISANLSGRTLTVNNNGSLVNNGTFEARDGGTLTLTPGSFTNFAGTVLTGGTYHVIGTSSLRFAGANIVTNAATLVLDGSGSNIFNGATATSGLANFASNASAGSFTVRNGRNFTTVGAFGNAGIVNVGSASTFTSTGAATNASAAELQLAGGTWAGAALGNAGLITGQGNITAAVSNTGTVLATGGTLSFAAGVQGNSGAVTVATGATLALGAAGSTGVFTDSGSLSLGSSNLTVAADYVNTNFGSGNGFNRRAGVTGTGQILAAGTTQQTVSGLLVQGGDTATPTLVLPNIRIGGSGITTTYTVDNVGSGGPALRGALQTTGISNVALSGSGVAAQNWGPVLQGGSTAAFSVTWNPAVGQALVDQSVALVNNFDNVAGQALKITGSAYNVAQASPATPSPVVLANQREGGTLSQALTISNTAPAGAFSEGLNGTIAANGTALASGSFSLLAAGSSSSALVVAVDTVSAGHKSGDATITLFSDGSGSSGFAPLALPGQTVTVSGDVYRLATASAATPNPVVLPNQRVGGTLSQAITYTNTATADGYSESLNGTPTANGNATAAGSFAQLAAGSSSSAIAVGVNTLLAGAQSGTVNIALASDGTGSSGLAPLPITGQQVQVSGNVYRLAAAGALPAVQDLGEQRIGGNAARAVTLSNVSAADGFSESLLATVSATPSAIVVGNYPLLAPGAASNAVVVSVDTTQPGLRAGTVTVQQFSSGQGSSGLPTLAIGAQTYDVTSRVFLPALADALPAAIVLPNQRVGGNTTQGLQVGNIAAEPVAGYTERLNGNIAVSAGQAIVGGSFAHLAAGAVSNFDLFVGVDTSAAGLRQGQARVDLVSTGQGGPGNVPAALNSLPPLVLASQFIAVSGAVYGPALPQVDVSPVLLVARRGAAAPTATVAVLNNGGDFAENLNASWGAANPAGFNFNGSVANLAGGQASNNLSVTLRTDTAGSYAGNASIERLSTVPAPTLAAPLPLGAVQVPVTGRVWEPAVAVVTPQVVNFGVVRTGSVPAARTLTVSNTNAGALTDTLNAALEPSGSVRFTSGGAVTGLASGASDNTSLVVTVNTAQPGQFEAFSVVKLASTNPDLAAMDLASAPVTFLATVNAYADPLLLKAGGSGTFSMAPVNPIYTLDFGTILVGGGAAEASLAVLNVAQAPADDLKGSWNLAGLAASGFTLLNFDSLTLAPQTQSAVPLLIALQDTAIGNYDWTFTLNAASSNADNPDASLGAIQVRLMGSVAAVPEPGTYAMLLGGGLLLMVWMRRNTARRRD